MDRSAHSKQRAALDKPDVPKADAPARDVMLVHGKTPDGSLRVLRAREDRVEIGCVSPLEHGKAIHGEVVRLTPRKDLPFICDVETQVDCRPRPTETETEDRSEPRAQSGRPGPAQVASESYRENWDRIWKRRVASEMN